MSFLSIGFLFAALAAGIPVMLHMIHRQNLRELPFSTLRFIRISEQKTRNKRRIQDLLLLLLRMAVLILIAFALAQPVVRNLSDLWGGAKTSAVLIIDNSASMGAIDDNAVRMETALRTAERVLNELDEGDRVAVLVPCGPSFPENGQLFASQQQVRRVLQQVKISNERADLSGAVSQARHLLLEADTPSRMIFVISDQQKVSWQTFADGAGTSDSVPGNASIPGNASVPGNAPNAGTGSNGAVDSGGAAANAEHTFNFTKVFHFHLCSYELERIILN